MCCMSCAACFSELATREHLNAIERMLVDHWGSKEFLVAKSASDGKERDTLAFQEGDIMVPHVI